MLPKRRLAADPEAMEKVEAALAVVLPFPVRPKQAAGGTEAGPAAKVVQLAPAPEQGERPTLLTPLLREWLKVALFVSVILHGAAFIIFELRFEGDLERAAGAAAALSSDGTVTIPVEIVVESPLPSALSPKDATEADAEQPSEAPPQKEVTDEKQPQLTNKQIQALIPLPDAMPVEVPQPPVQAAEQPKPEAPVETLPARQDSARIAMPEEAIAPPLPVETAKVSEAPAATVVMEETPPLPLAREPIRQLRKDEPKKPKAELPRKKQKATQSNAGRAASPSRAAAANSAGRAGAGGTADTGGSAAVSSYKRQLIAHLSRFRVYPPEAQSRGLAGVARVNFALGRNGQVLSVSLASGSGVAVLDQAARDMVRRASPFPPFPASMPQAREDFLGLPIRFGLN